MAGELQISFASGRTIYFMVFNTNGKVFNANTNLFESYLTANLSNYSIAGAQLGAASSFYIGNFPAVIVAGVYAIVGKQQLGGSPAETDPTIGIEDPFNWNGSAEAALSDAATSGLVGQFLPIRFARGNMIKPFTFKLVSSVDNFTNFLSGIISGQISRDGGAFGALQSGAFTEIGLGHYSLQALTSGDLNAGIANLVFTGVGISGGTSAQRDFVIPLQRVSGF